MGTKKCNTCKEEKSLDCFNKHSRNPDGLSYKCKRCRSEYRQKFKKRRSKYNKKYRQKHKKKLNKRKRQWHEENKEQQNKYCRKYYREHKEEIQKRVNKYQKERRQKDEEFRLICNMRGRMKKAISRGDKSKKTEELLGCSIEEFKKYLEKQFTDKMSWDNYGDYWHIDHIVPLSSFDLTKPHHQKEAFFYTNCQPMWWKDNLEKSNK